MSADPAEEPVFATYPSLDKRTAFVSGAGFEVSVVSGGPASTIHEKEAGVASTLPAPSLARTLKVWLPSGSDVVV